jgi:large subunit ribosomal protein L10
LFSGPVLVALSRQEPNAAAKIVRHFRKQNDRLEVKGLALNGVLYSASDLEQVANLPTKDEARAQLLGVMKAPMTQLVRTIAEPPTRLVRVISAIRDKKQTS